METQEVYAYSLDIYNIMECYEISQPIIVFDSGLKGYQKRVKQKLWDIIEPMELRHDWDNRWINFDDVQFYRNERFDKRMYKGVFISRGKYNNILSKRIHSKRIQSILNDDNITHCHIMKRGSYYCDNYNGYTSKVTHAGVYLKSDAADHAEGILEINLSPINNKEHNEMLNKEIEFIKTHLI